MTLYMTILILKTAMNNFVFSEVLEKFFKTYLPGEVGVSSNSIRSYRDTFVLFFEYMDRTNKVKPDKISLSHFKKEEILLFLKWLEEIKGNSISTRNQRLAAIRSFCNLVMFICPEYVHACSEIRSIKYKKAVKDTVKYMTIEEVTALLSQIDTRTKSGRRDLTLLSLLYNTGARVQEVIDLTPSNFRLEKPAIVELYGKGRKKRIVPLDEPIVKLLQGYMREQGLSNVVSAHHPLFFNSQGSKLTNPGISYIINKYVSLLKAQNAEMCNINITPHVFRHSRAMHLLQVGIPLIYIRDILGHVSVQTTEIYARTDSKAKREALEKAYEDIGIIEPEIKSWDKDSKLKAFLKSLV